MPDFAYDLIAKHEPGAIAQIERLRHCPIPAKYATESWARKRIDNAGIIYGFEKENKSQCLLYGMHRLSDVVNGRPRIATDPAIVEAFEIDFAADSMGELLKVIESIKGPLTEPPAMFDSPGDDDIVE